MPTQMFLIYALIFVAPILVLLYIILGLPFQVLFSQAETEEVECPDETQASDWLKEDILS
jgi:hypothetical protein